MCMFKLLQNALVCPDHPRTHGSVQITPEHTGLFILPQTTLVCSNHPRMHWSVQITPECTGLFRLSPERTGLFRVLQSLQNNRVCSEFSRVRRKLQSLQINPECCRLPQNTGAAQRPSTALKGRHALQPPPTPLAGGPRGAT